MWWIAAGIIAAIVIFRLVIDRTGAEVKITSGEIDDDKFSGASLSGHSFSAPSSVLYEDDK
ncbi:MAG: hypothetical protein M1510_07940 [Nitrospirae bacterium]|nr:hypothetical protein [Nitrospirota bacterium]MCL5237064.1 hypothetical protein [Nitrospirota bacterium]